MGTANGKREMVLEKRWARMAHPPSAPSVEPMVHSTAHLRNGASNVRRVHNGKQLLGQPKRRPFRRDPRRRLANPWEPRRNARSARGMGRCGHAVCHGIAWMGSGQNPGRWSGGCGKVPDDVNLQPATLPPRHVDRDHGLRACGLGNLAFCVDLVCKRSVLPSCVSGNGSVPIVARQRDSGKMDKRRARSRWRIDGESVPSF
jgi:hypothetical protein